LTVLTLISWPSIVVNVFFIGIQEYSIWICGPNAESFRHIGQWGVLVGLCLVAGAAYISSQADPRQ
jgi:hypothetical protein